MRDSERFEQELRLSIANLEWLCDHFDKLGSDDIRARVAESLARQKRLLDHVEKHAEAFLEDHPLEEDLKAFRDGQRDLLLNIVRRFAFHDKVDCGRAIGRENISTFILGGQVQAIDN